MDKFLCEWVKAVDASSVCTDPNLVLGFLERLRTVLLLSPRSLPGGTSVYVFMETSRMLISPLRMLPAHILLLQSLYRHKIELAGSEQLSLPGICSNSEIRLVSGSRILMPPPSVPIQISPSRSARLSMTLLLKEELWVVYVASSLPSRVRQFSPPLQGATQILFVSL